MANLNDVAKCFLHLDSANEGEGISNLKLQKLSYYAQGYYCALFDDALFPNSIYAWNHGPVVEELYHAYKHNGSSLITYQNDFDKDSLSQDEYDLIEEVYEVFGQFSAWKLRNMTHEESPWLNHENAADEIPLLEIQEYFKTRLN